MSRKGTRLGMAFRLWKEMQEYRYTSGHSSSRPCCEGRDCRAQGHVKLPALHCMIRAIVMPPCTSAGLGQTSGPSLVLLFNHSSPAYSPSQPLHPSYRSLLEERPIILTILLTAYEKPARTARNVITSSSRQQAWSSLCAIQTCPTGYVE